MKGSIIAITAGLLMAAMPSLAQDGAKAIILAQAQPSNTALIDINRASKEELEALPEIGVARSEAIIKGRPYQRKDELVQKKIISESVYKEIQHKIIAHQM
jgi:DNA uptake protein ComE-like DNA-binding protein